MPDEIPEELTIDVSKLTMGQAVRASDVVLPGSVRLVSPPEAVISHIVAMKAEEVVAPVAGAEVAPAAVAEPEVIKKGKKEEDEEAAADDKKKKK